MDKKKYALLDCRIAKVDPVQNLNFSYEEGDKRFAKVKIYVMYPGLNRNNSSIAKELVEQKLQKGGLFNIPVVGEWKADADGENGRFGGHGVRVIISDTSVTCEKDTQPYGVVNESAEVSWETVVEEDGVTENEYLTTTALLWQSEYPDEVGYVLTNGAWQSMEILLLDYETDENGVLIINDFEFSALCLLGKSNDPKLNVAPCFESAQAVEHSAEFSLKVQKMLGELQAFDLKQKEYTANEGSVLKTMSLTPSQLIDEFNLIFSKETFEDRWGWTSPKYRYIDSYADTGVVVVYDCENDWTYAGFDYAVDGDTVTVAFDSKRRMKQMFVEMEGEETTASFDLNAVFDSFAENLKDGLSDTVVSQEQYSELQAELDAKIAEAETFAAEHASVVAELAAIREKDALEKKREMYADFEAALKDDDNYIALRDVFAEMTCDELYTKLSLMYTAKALGKEFGVTGKEEALVTCGIDVPGKKMTARYGNLFG